MMIRGISSMATRPLLAELVAAYRARGGVAVEIESVGGVDAARRVAAGEPFDLVLLASDALDRLIAAGHLAAPRLDWVHSPVAIAVRAGAARPDVGSEEALKQAVRAARHLAFSTGPSGTHLQRLFERWGLADALQSRLVQAPPGVPVGRLVADGQADLGFQQLSELMHQPGVDVVGTLPPAVEFITTFSAALPPAGAQADAVRALLAFLTSPETVPAMQRHGMTPARPGPAP